MDDDKIIRLPGGQPARQPVEVPINLALKLVVVEAGDVVVTGGGEVFHLGPGTWRIVGNDIYERLFVQATSAAPESGPSRAARRKQAARDRRN